MALLYFNYITPLLSLTVAVSGRSTPTISYVSPEQIRDVGTQVELLCSVDYPVVWVKYDSVDKTAPRPLSSTSGLITNDPRISLDFVASSSASILTIKDIQESDAGRYQCQVRTDGSLITADVELQVRRPPVISDNSTRFLLVSLGESAQMECYADGYPAPKIWWRREYKAALPLGGSIYRGNVLNIPSVQKEHAGTYFCVAENGVGRGTRRSIDLQVEFAPVITVPRPRVGQTLKNDTNLGCHVEAYPPPAITWHKDGEVISNNQHYSMSNFGTANDVTDALLRVTAIEKLHYGLFTCKAQNKLGVAEGQVELFEITNPSSPVREEASHNETTSIAP